MNATIANTEMASAWDGDEGDDWTEYADRYDAAGAGHWQAFLAAVQIRPSDRIVDIGCGTGQSTRDAARLATMGSVLGVDLGTRMLDEARRRTAAEALGNVEYAHADAQVHEFDPASFDLAISRFGAMFFNDAPAAFANIARALRAGGRLGLISWQPLDRNPWLVAFRTALAAGRDLPTPPAGGAGPFGLADPDQVTELLRGAGFDAVKLAPSEAPMYLGRDCEDAWEFVQTMGIFRGLTHGLDEHAKATAVTELQAVLARSAGDEGVALGSTAWIITATRRS